MEKFEDILMTAIDNIDQNYYKVKTTYNHGGIIRERVFCYELYYQMRLLKKDNQFFIHPEIDKSGHDEFDVEDRKNPDFLYHIPGDFHPESVISEVKGTLSRGINELIKDFQTIQRFIKKYNYKKGYFLLYNHSFDELKENFNGVNLTEFNGIKNSVKVICKKSFKNETEQKFLKDLF